MTYFQGWKYHKSSSIQEEYKYHKSCDVAHQLDILLSIRHLSAMPEPLQPGYYFIKSPETNAYIGRGRPEDRSLLPKKVVHAPRGGEPQVVSSLSSFSWRN